VIIAVDTRPNGGVREAEVAAEDMGSGYRSYGLQK
jgi:hypothetical protein